MTKTMRNKKKACFWWLSVAVVMAVIFVFSAMDAAHSGALSQWVTRVTEWLGLSSMVPSFGDSGTEGNLRKCAHVFLYFCLCVTAWNAWRHSEQSADMLRTGILSFFVCFFYACTDEWHQTFVPGRSGEFRDVCIDMIGVVIWLLIQFIWRRFHARD